jgi:hypothetical protein
MTGMPDRWSRVWALVSIGVCVAFAGLTLAATSSCGGGSAPAGAITKAKAIAIAKDYIDQVDRGHTTTAPPGVSAPTVAPIEIDVTSAVFGHPTDPDTPTDMADTLVWTIKMNTSRTSFPVVVLIDATTGEIVQARIW